MEKARQFLSQRSFQLMIFQAGADSVAGDPITHLKLSASAHFRMVSFLKELSRKSSMLPLIILGGGGYNPNNTAEVWLKIVNALIK